MTPEATNELRTGDVVIYGNSTDPSFRHEIPTPIVDPALYVEHMESRYLLAYAEEDLDPLKGVANLITFEELGLNEFQAQGDTLPQAVRKALVKGCAAIGLTAAQTPRNFPLDLAELFQAHDIQLRVAGEIFDRRRRAKSPRELDGIKRAQRAGEAAMEVITDTLRSTDDVPVDRLRSLARRVLIDHGAVPHDILCIACGPQGATVHHEGSAPIQRHQPVLIDIFARDIRSGCWGDLARTVCVGRPPERLQNYHADVLEAMQRTIAAVRPGVSGGDLNRISGNLLASKGHRIRSSVKPGEVLRQGVLHGVGHGIGLELHEAPWLEEGGVPLVAGDVIAIEPAVYYPDFGGVRIEDLVLVTEDGHEVLTKCPYDLELAVG